MKIKHEPTSGVRTMTKRLRETVSTEALQRYQRDFDIKDSEMSKLLCQTNSVVARWHKVGMMPKWVLLCLEGLRRRSKANELQAGIIQVRKDKRERLDKLLEIVEIKIQWIEQGG